MSDKLHHAQLRDAMGLGWNLSNAVDRAGGLASDGWEKAGALIDIRDGKVPEPPQDIVDSLLAEIGMDAGRAYEYLERAEPNAGVFASLLRNALLLDRPSDFKTRDLRLNICEEADGLGTGIHKSGLLAVKSSVIIDVENSTISRDRAVELQGYLGGSQAEAAGVVGHIRSISEELNVYCSRQGLPPIEQLPSAGSINYDLY